jgi:hypothetical protein
MIYFKAMTVAEDEEPYMISDDPAEQAADEAHKVLARHQTPVLQDADRAVITAAEV